MIPLKLFGRTGHESTRTIFGAACLSSVTRAQADRTLELLLEYGVNHIDTAASYGDSEVHIGSWMKNYRSHFFLATKTEKRTYREAKEELYRSLDRLNVDYVDLWQMHLLVDPEEWGIALSSYHLVIYGVLIIPWIIHILSRIFHPVGLVLEKSEIRLVYLLKRFCSLRRKRTLVLVSLDHGCIL